LFKPTTPTSLSKLFACYAEFEWGLRDVNVLGPYSFQATGKKGPSKFLISVQDHKDFNVELPAFDEEFVILWIQNKVGDNCVVMAKEDCKVGKMNFKEIAEVIKVKFRAEKPDTDFLSRARDRVQEK
jgi:hypothetical protein